MLATCNPLHTIRELSQLLSSGMPLIGKRLEEARRLAAEGGEIGQSLLRLALEADGAMQKPALFDHLDGGKTQGGGDCLPEASTPLTPYVEGFFGTFVSPVARPRDPAVLRISRLEKGSTLWFINRRSNLGADKAEQACWTKLPYDGNPDPEGRANVVLSDQAAKELGINPGDVLEVFQTNKRGKVSGSDFVAINRNIPNTRVPNPIGVGNTTWVGVQSSDVRPQLLTAGDSEGPAAHAPGFQQRLSKCGPGGRWELQITPHKGMFAIEPFSKVVIDRPPFYSGHYTQDVKSNGSFELKTWDAEPDDAVVLRLFDHSTAWKMGQGALPTERRVVMAAGGKDAVVVDNPAAGHQRKLEASLGRITLAHDHIAGAPGSATPGSIVLLYNQSNGSKFAAAVGSDGSFCHTLKANVGDQIALTLLHAFDAPELRVDLGVHEVGCRPQALDRASAPVGDNHADRLRVEVSDCSVGFSNYDWNTGNYAHLKAKSDWSGRVDSVFTMDRQAGEVVVRVSVGGGGGLREKELGADKSVQSYFGQLQQSNWTSQNNEPGAFREVIQQRGKGGRLAVRFENDDGHVFARGELKIDVVQREHSTGAPQKIHPVWVATLEPGSLRQLG